MTDMSQWTGNGFEIDGIYYDDEHTYYQNKCLDVLGWCGCGSPENCLDLIKQVLLLLNREDKGKWDELEKLIPQNEARDIIYYLLDDKDLTSHGSCIPGWTSEEGKEFIKMLEKECELRPENRS